MTWNHRVTKQVFEGETMYAIREVYYDGGKIIGWTEEVIGAAGDDVQEVFLVLGQMVLATQKPVIDITDEDNPVEEK